MLAYFDHNTRSFAWRRKFAKERCSIHIGGITLGLVTFHRTQ
ncbi:hypothetical protein DR64_7673 [Paraburkholderia xenovorans LB400]|nr:hypothetical protein DR64_7673 [Paraburkholderia xenovorans LB400]